MDFNQEIIPSTILHWNYRGFTEFPLQKIRGEEADITDIYLKENLISRVPSDIGRLENLESLYLTGNDISELPPEISQLRSLKCLDVSGNRLERVPDEIGDVRGLKFLILDENELRALPLRLAELSALRYLSVCDNKLQWLPQKPVYNYHHCEFRFWRNPDLKALPYSLWYHMFRDQQTRSLNIGTLNISSEETQKTKRKCRITITKESNIHFVDIVCEYNSVFDRNSHCPPTLYELTRRKFYQMIYDTANYQNNNSNNYNHYHCYVNSLRKEIADINLEEDSNNNDIKINKQTCKNKAWCENLYCPVDIIKEYYNFLPRSIHSELANGPISKCENYFCKKPIFDYAHLEYCKGNITLIDKIEDILLSATFCSKQCAATWRKEREVIPWVLI